ncbi:hypothetical protein CFC21_101354 [Triticum aestivum]|uniref:Fe2OG dioxygenase domain-containing protein n=3 Tax=Triticum TaxID=4564 RepID=A0A9R0ZVI5_TRITD|nr:hypothetical protein CFC21_101354 [Triticum aestivum]VAI83287.1 unnamed protein product [Triticum turgidum subsp. durum]
MADAEPWKTVKIPPIVQELATGMQEPPSRYVIAEQNRPTAAGFEMPDPIPIIDLSRLSANCADEVAKLRSALEKWGLFLAVGHGMEQSFLGEVMGVAREFFKLPLEEKQKYSNLVNGNEVRIEGYGNDMVVSEKQILDWCDRLYIIVEPENRRIYSLWPTQPPSFRDILSEYTVRCRKIANLFLQNLAKLLDLHEDYFVNMFDENALTYASGLQLQKDGVWYNVPIVPNTLLVNVGDVMEIMSNGFFKSPIHRVVTNVEKERLSLVMFYTMNPEKEIEPLSELVDEKRPRRYRKTTTNDYIAKLFETFARGTLAIDTVKI